MLQSVFIADRRKIALPACFFNFCLKRFFISFENKCFQMKMFLPAFLTPDKYSTPYFPNETAQNQAICLILAQKLLRERHKQNRREKLHR
ncbi:MAG TPA: hypothetical protein DCL44_04730 [Elusimicrobia bacterium]|nr:hypothetical protein [Elusimicrobiota bacterium]